MPIPDPAWGLSGWIDYFSKDLKHSIKTDVDPLVPTLGLFGVPRQFFCYVDYLGALWEGPTTSTVSRKAAQGIKDLATTAKAISVLQGVFGKVYAPYATQAKNLVNMYRHGLVHSYAPKVLKRNSDGEGLAWLSYAGPRSCPYGPTTLTHLLVYKPNPALPLSNLPVSITCLAEDLRLALDQVVAELQAEAAAGVTTRIDKMRATAAELAVPATGPFTW